MLHHNISNARNRTNHNWNNNYNPVTMLILNNRMVTEGHSVSSRLLNVKLLHPFDTKIDYFTEVLPSSVRFVPAKACFCQTRGLNWYKLEKPKY